MQQLAKQFVPAADEVERYQRARPPRRPDVELFWKIAAQRPEHETLPGQGIYVLTPGGKLLAFRQRDHDPDSIANILTQALAQWNQLPDHDRLGRPSHSMHAQPAHWQRPPAGGMVLELFVRDLPRKTGAVEPRLAAMWNHDFAWFTRSDVRSMIPQSPRPGQRFQVSSALVRRLARLHLLDSVRGINDARPFADKDVQQAEMFFTVTKIEGDVVHLKIEGHTRAVEPGLADSAGSAWPDAKERGYEARLLGQGIASVRQGTFLSFKLVAVGPRWGGRGHTHSMRPHDLGPQPMGFAFRLVPSAKVTEIMVPHNAEHYFTR